MTITKIVMVNPFDNNPEWVLYSNVYPNGVSCSPTYFLPLLQAQDQNRYWCQLVVGKNGQYQIVFSLTAPNIAIVVTADGDSVSSELPFEYIFETTDGNGNPLSRLVNDNQALHGYDNGNSAVNCFSLPKTTGQSFGEVKLYKFVIAKRQTTFAADWTVTIKGACNQGTSTVSAVVNPSNAGEWLVTVDFKEVFVDATPFVDPIPPNPSNLAATNFLSVLLAECVTV